MPPSELVVQTIFDQPDFAHVIGVAEVLGGLGMVLPALTGILPILTPLAGAGLALVMAGTAIFHFPRKEYGGSVFNLVLLALAAFVAYGRFVVVPL